HITYALGYIVTWEELHDNLYMEISKRRSSANAFSMRQTKETVGANFYNRAFNASFPMADGVAVISASHPLIGGGTFSNLASGDLSEAALEDICIQIYGATNDEGLRIALQPKSLIIPRQLWFKANRILKSVLQNDTANNAVNVLKLVNSFPEGIKMNQYLTDPDAWFVRTQVSEGGLVHFNRNSIEFVQDNDFDTRNAKAYSIERYSFGIADPRALYGSAGA
ncbi:MAG: Mu-like prophage major head subunit gpT family protein, partial [Bacteroidota bacterium]